MNKREEERECLVAAIFVTEHNMPCIVLCFELLFLVWLVSTQWKIDLSFGADDELVKKEAKAWRRGDGKEAIKEEKEDRIKRQGKKGSEEMKEKEEKKGQKEEEEGRKVWLHFPNTSTYYTDHIWIKLKVFISLHLLFYWVQLNCGWVWVAIGELSRLGHFG